MTNSSETGDAGRSSSFRPMRSAEKSSTFSQTCSLLSQYLKDKKTTTSVVTTFGDLALAINNNNSDSHGMKTTTMPDSYRQSVATTMDLFPQQSGFAPNDNKSQQQQQKQVDEEEAENGRRGGAQMTIFYNGQVIVLNDFPADKAKQVMALAAKESASSTALPPIQKPPPMIIEKPTTCANRNPTALASSPGLVVARPKPVTAIPIARKASLTRFLEKRKDRITTRAPYPVSNSSNAKAFPLPQKAGETTKALSWLGLGAQYPPVQYGHQC